MERKIPTGWEAFKVGFGIPKTDTAIEAAKALGYARYLKGGGAVVEGLFIGVVTWLVGVVLLDAAWWVPLLWFVVIALASYWRAHRLEVQAHRTLRYFDQLAEEEFSR